MNTKETQQKQARELYFQTDLTQQQIADIIDVNRKTVGLWIHHGKWRDMKRAAQQSPGMALNELYDQLFALNNNIANRTDHPYPTIEESIVQRRLMMSIKSIEQQPISNYVQIFTELQMFLLKQDMNLAKQLLPFTDRFIKTKSARSHSLTTTQDMYLEDIDDDIDEEPNTDEKTISPIEEEIKETPPQNENKLEDKPDNKIHSPIEEETRGISRQNKNKSEHNIDNKTLSPVEGGIRGMSPENETFGDISDNTISPQQQATQHNAQDQNSQNNSFGNGTIKKKIQLPSGITWLGYGLVFDPVTNKKREIKIGEYNELLRMGYTARDLNY